ncbi:hypothetical protein [Shewanella phaeophyticola]|uniref:Uncharacterized protein n=1 Tax=Shewanella phaeophyticola TaxID=2978345 RepID=A0ABT2P2I5_9GAMM|nr:hypothetical protein [Shewanella sp. KJ10-1]MCT8985880.1 hypothetical protein [Shewanella sp. KJ10-1]
MMKDWLKKLLGRPIATKRNKVQIDMRYEVHSFKSDDAPVQNRVNEVDHTDSYNQTHIEKPTK